MKRPLLTIFGLLLTYIVASMLLLNYYSLPSISSGLNEAEAGQQQLFSDPKQAVQHFQLAQERFQLTIDRLKRLPLLSKALVLLPPFRYEVDFLKSMYALSQSGQAVAGLVESYPSVSAAQDPAALWVSGSQAWASWYPSQQAQFSELAGLLGYANQQLALIPNWGLPSSSQNLKQLKGQVKQVAENQARFSRCLPIIERSLGSGQQFLVLFDAPGNDSYLGLTAANGAFQTVQFVNNPLPAGLVATGTVHLSPAWLKMASQRFGLGDLSSLTSASQLEKISRAAQAQPGKIGGLLSQDGIRFESSSSDLQGCFTK